jgi:hypothetical protein
MGKRVRLAFWGREETQHRKFLGDAVKAMLHFGSDEEHAPGGDFLILIARPESPVASNNVVHLILMMRALQVRSSSSEYIQTSTHRRNPEKLEVCLLTLAALLLKLLGRK